MGATPRNKQPFERAEELVNMCQLHVAGQTGARVAVHLLLNSRCCSPSVTVYYGAPGFGQFRLSTVHIKLVAVNTWLCKGSDGSADSGCCVEQATVQLWRDGSDS